MGGDCRICTPASTPVPSPAASLAAFAAFLPFKYSMNARNNATADVPALLSRSVRSSACVGPKSRAHPGSPPAPPYFAAMVAAAMYGSFGDLMTISTSAFTSGIRPMASQSAFAAL